MVLILVAVLVIAAAGVYFGAINGFIVFSPQDAVIPEGDPSKLIIGNPVQNRLVGSGQTDVSGTSVNTSNMTYNGTQTANGSNQGNTTIRTIGFGGGGSGSGGGGGDGSGWTPPATPPSNPPDNKTSTSIYFMPGFLSADMGQTFNITVYVNTTESVYAAQYYVHYDTTKLNATNLTEGDFLKKSGASTYPIINNNYTSGIINFGNTRFGTPDGATGNGTLLFINFHALGMGIVSLTLDNAALVDPSPKHIDGIEVFNGSIAIVV